VKKLGEGWLTEKLSSQKKRETTGGKSHKLESAQASQENLGGDWCQLKRGAKLLRLCRVCKGHGKQVKQGAVLPSAQHQWEKMIPSIGGPA